MLIVIILIGLLFIGVGYLVNEKNAKYLLSGYNTLSESQRQQFDLASYLNRFRKFHLFLGISFISLGLIAFYFLGIKTTGFFLAIYPLLGYMVFLFLTDQYWHQASSSMNKVGLIVLGFSLLLVLLLFFLI